MSGKCVFKGAHITRIETNFLSELFKDFRAAK